MSCGNVSKQSNDPQLGCPRCGVNGSMVVLFIPHRHRREFRAVNRDFASSLIQLNNTFYREHSASFSDTRQAPWPGWVRTMDIALGQLEVATIEHPVRVFDLACGNMRFENFAAGGALAAKGVDGANPSADASCPFEFYGVDSCQDLAIDAHGHALRIPNLHFQELDVLDALMKLNPAETPDVLFDAPLADISVCFGFMHHVPSCEYRVRVLDALVRQTRPGGIIAISFWEFMNDERMARKAVRAEARAERRRKELEEKGQPADFATVLADIRQRDYQDSHRAVAPLKQADDAILVDTSSIGLQESFDLLKRTILAHI